VVGSAPAGPSVVHGPGGTSGFNSAFHALLKACAYEPDKQPVRPRLTLPRPTSCVPWRAATGDRLTRAEFERRYAAMTGDLASVLAELEKGVAADRGDYWIGRILPGGVAAGEAV
jgi:hypothetical protein